jgi:glyoxylase-like metal-dependent hydrolase (beta-lactamase superfamily II)
VPALAPASNSAVAWTPRSVRAGEWTITALSDGFFRLDGGSMWGVVPKNLWARMTPPADDNTILLALRPFLAVRGDDVVVIEGGLGDRWDEKWRGIYHVERSDTLESTLRACGHAPEEVTHVVASHCHFDHIGALVEERDGTLAPLFPNARHFAPAVEVEVCSVPTGARRASYRADDVLPLLDAGLVETYEGNAELLPGLRAHVLGGHSDGVSVITLNEQGAGDTAVFWADVVPTAHHAQPPYIMAYDIDVVRSFDVRGEWIARAADAGWIGMLYHDPDVAFARLHRGEKRYEVEVLE